MISVDPAIPESAFCQQNLDNVGGISSCICQINLHFGEPTYKCETRNNLIFFHVADSAIQNMCQQILRCNYFRTFTFFIIFFEAKLVTTKSSEWAE